MNWQTRVEGSLTPLVKGWFRSPCRASRWGLLYLVGPSQPRAAAPGSFPIREVTFHVPRASFYNHILDCQGPCLWLPPKTLCTWPLWPLLQVVNPQEGGPTLPLWAEPDWTPWAKVQPPGACRSAPPPDIFSILPNRSFIYSFDFWKKKKKIERKYQHMNCIMWL